MMNQKTEITVLHKPGDKLDVGDAADVAEDPLHDAPLVEVDGVSKLVRDPGPGPQPRPLGLPCSQLATLPCPHQIISGVIKPR